MKTSEDLNAKRANLKIFYSSQFKLLKTLSKIAIKSSTNETHKFGDLMRFLGDKDFLIQAMGNISTKAGALTPGVDNITADEASLDLINNITQDIKNNKFRFKPIRRFYVDKTGKNRDVNTIIENIYYKEKKITKEKLKEIKARPLGIPSFKDKIVQEAIRMILNAIYEVEFAKLNTNFGFRPKYGTHDAILNMQAFAKSMDFAIEADVQGAFDNVDFQVLLNILRKKIKDEKFLNIILQGLNCGINFANNIEQSKIGTTQGSVASPILYNIYFNEFDKYIKTDFAKVIENINTTEKRIDKPAHKIYNKVSIQKSELKYFKHKEKLLQIYEKHGKNSEIYKDFRKDFQIIKEKYMKLDQIQKKFPSKSKLRQTIRFFYVRYADDWVFLTNADLNRTKEFKEMFSQWITDNLKLTLSPEKTLITNLKKGKIHFLGFQLNYTSTKRIMEIGSKVKIKLDLMNRTKTRTIKIENPTRRFKQRTTNPTLITAFDRTRVLFRLEQNRFIKKFGTNWRGCRKPEWTTLELPEIIERYNYIIRGYLDYYGPITTYSLDVQQIHYLLTYSCVHTLANKLNTSLRAIFRKFGKNLRINWEALTTTTNKQGFTTTKKVQKSIALLNWEQCKGIINQRIINLRKKQKTQKGSPFTPQFLVNKSIDEISNVKVNWRTKFKLSQHCSICGSTEDIQYHHVKHIKIGKTEGFLQILKQLNRKQIPCCVNCHRKIHRGEYNDIALKDLYDEELIIL